jgi:hypothetical protein
MFYQSNYNKNLLITPIWKWLIIVFWVLLVAVMFFPATEQGSIIWYLGLSASIFLVAACILLVTFALVVIFIKRKKLGVVSSMLASLFVIIFNVPGSIVLYAYLKNQRVIG